MRIIRPADDYATGQRGHLVDALPNPGSVEPNAERTPVVVVTQADHSTGSSGIPPSIHSNMVHCDRNDRERRATPDVLPVLFRRTGCTQRKCPVRVDESGRDW